jgi:hypothetical protein
MLDGVQQATDGAADDGDPARHRLEGHDAERLVPGHARHEVSRAQQGGNVGPGDRAQQLHSVIDTEAARDRYQSPRLAVLGEGVGGRSAGDEQLSAG